MRDGYPACGYVWPVCPKCGPTSRVNLLFVTFKRGKALPYSWEKKCSCGQSYVLNGYDDITDPDILFKIIEKTLKMNARARYTTTIPPSIIKLPRKIWKEMEMGISVDQHAAMVRALGLSFMRL